VAVTGNGHVVGLEMSVSGIGTINRPEKYQ
jgi:hypothetical protein